MKISTLIIAKELRFLCDGQDGHYAQGYDATRQVCVGRWWCDGYTVAVGPIPGEDFVPDEGGFDGFSKEYLEPAARAWKERAISGVPPENPPIFHDPSVEWARVSG